MIRVSGRAFGLALFCFRTPHTTQRTLSPRGAGPPGVGGKVSEKLPQGGRAGASPASLVLHPTPCRPRYFAITAKVASRHPRGGTISPSGLPVLFSNSPKTPLYFCRTSRFCRSIRVGSTERCFQSSDSVNVFLCNRVRSIKSHAVSRNTNRSSGFPLEPRMRSRIRTELV